MPDTPATQRDLNNLQREMKEDMDDLYKRLDRIDQKLDDLRTSTIPDIKTQAALVKQEQTHMIQSTARKTSALTSLVVGLVVAFGKWLLDNIGNFL